MSRLTLRLPDSLHRRLEALAQEEDVSLNQYIVYSLTRRVTEETRVDTVPGHALREQRAAYDALLERLGRAAPEQVEAALATREAAAPEDELTPEIVENLPHPWRQLRK